MVSDQHCSLKKTISLIKNIFDDKELAHENRLDQALMETFPASDPVSIVCSKKIKPSLSSITVQDNECDASQNL